MTRPSFESVMMFGLALACFFLFVTDAKLTLAEIRLDACKSQMEAHP